MADISRNGKRYQSKCCPHKTDPAERYIAAKRPETAKSDLTGLPKPILTSNSGRCGAGDRTPKATCHSDITDLCDAVHTKEVRTGTPALATSALAWNWFWSRFAK